jgi:hypothetical protein
MDWERLVYDFIAGGALIATILALAKVFGPFIAGIIAALPVRLGATLFLSGITNSPAFVTGMLRGSIPASFGAFGFMVTLSKTTTRLGLWKSFILACVVCLLIIFAGLSIQ